MQYIAIDRRNDNPQCVFEQRETPQIKDDHLLIKVHAIGVNRADLLQKQGQYPPPKGESDILGLEVCGVIEAVGSNVASWKVGNRVFGLVPGGAYAEYVEMRADQAIKLPEPFSFTQGAGIAEVFLTAYQCLVTIAGLEAEQNVLIHGGASGVGTAAIQLAKSIGANVVVTVGSDEKAMRCKALGADVALNYQQQKFSQWQKDNLPQGFDVIIDMVAGDYVSENLSAVGLDGHIVVLAMLAGRYANKFDVAKLLAKRVTLQGTTLRNRSHAYRAKLTHGFCKDFYGELANGNIYPVIDKVYPWQDVEQAHAYMQENKNIGKIILSLE